jgi:hypothetical protein
VGRALIESGDLDSDIAEFGRFPEALPESGSTIVNRPW